MDQYWYDCSGGGGGGGGQYQQGGGGWEESSRDIIAGHVLTACNCVNNIQLIQLQPLPENGIKLRHNKEPDTIPFFFFFFLVFPLGVSSVVYVHGYSAYNRGVRLCYTSRVYTGENGPGRSQTSVKRFSVVFCILGSGWITLHYTGLILQADFRINRTIR